jgi:hypothetical protein
MASRNINGARTVRPAYGGPPRNVPRRVDVCIRRVSATHTAKRVSGFAVAPVDAIADRQVRDVLRGSTKQMGTPSRAAL